jgi:hypothetical protein
MNFHTPSRPDSTAVTMKAARVGPVNVARMSSRIAAASGRLKGSTPRPLDETHTGKKVNHVPANARIKYAISGWRCTSANDFGSVGKVMVFIYVILLGKWMYSQISPIGLKPAGWLPGGLAQALQTLAGLFGISPPPGLKPIGWARKGGLPSPS